MRNIKKSGRIYRCTNVEYIKENLRGHGLRFLGHLERINVESLTRKNYEKRITENTRRERPKET